MISVKSAFILASFASLANAVPTAILKDKLQTCLAKPDLREYLEAFGAEDLPQFQKFDLDQPPKFRVSYLQVTDDKAESCEGVLADESVEVTVGNPIRDLCKVAGPGAEVRFCALRPARLLLKAAEKTRDSERPLIGRISQYISEGPLRNRNFPLTDEDLLSIERNSDNYLGVCVECPDNLPE